MNTYEEQRLREALNGEARRATGTVTWDQVLRRARHPTAQPPQVAGPGIGRRRRRRRGGHDRGN
jgi:hypothetical protein